MQLKADLHLHTYFSDGYLSPSAILSKAKAKGLNIISITDHDTLAGYLEASSIADSHRITLIPGIELSSDFNGVEVHILGYFIDHNSDALNSYLEDFVAERNIRTNKIIQKLNNNGIDITLDEVLAEAKFSHVIGRPHIARALIRKKIASNFKDVFNKYLGNHSIAFEKKFFITPVKATEIIRDAGGISVLAHPGNYKKELLIELLEQGINGIEVFHPSHSISDINFLFKTANEKGLLITGGSDYHGGNSKDEVNFGKYYLHQNNITPILEYYPNFSPHI